MPAEVARAGDRAVQAGVAFLARLLRDYHPRDFAVRFWDGTTWGPEPGEPARFTLALQHPGALRRMFWPPTDATIGEAYIYDDFDVEGEIARVFPLGDWFFDRRRGLAERLGLAASLLSLPRGQRTRSGRPAARLSGRLHSIARDRQAVAYHYDVSNEFYRLWLGDGMVYSCAYFTSPEESVDVAQQRKVDYVCRKARLQAGERLLDLGCGWGTLVLHAAREYGVEALGVTLSRPQTALAQERIRAAGLEGRCRVEALDYREVDEPEGFDKIVSVGMSEHVGRRRLGEFFRRAYRLLRPGGVFLHHAITRHATEPEGRRTGFINRHIFPDGELVPISTTLQIAEQSGFEIRDVEDLREHYALTLEQWVRRLEARHDEATRLTDETTYRAWRLYMAGSAHGFWSGRIGIYQTLLSKPERGASRLPLTRADWYR